MDHPLGEEIQDCSNEVPRVMYGPAPGLKLYIVLYREMLKNIILQNCFTKWDTI